MYTTLYGSISTTMRSMMDFSMRCTARWSSGHCFDRSVDAGIDSCTSVGVALTCSSNFIFFAGGSALQAFSFAEYETNCSLSKLQDELLIRTQFVLLVYHCQMIAASNILFTLPCWHQFLTYKTIPRSGCATMQQTNCKQQTTWCHCTLHSAHV